jgi:L-ascorbate metabolism protein UlaG (beta-lactamase superfamily)
VVRRHSKQLPPASLTPPKLCINGLVQHESGAAPFFKHFNGKRFFNPLAPQVPGFLSVLRWKRTSRPERSPHFTWDVQQSKPPASVGGDDVLVTLINHSTLLVQQCGVNILTDPMWSQRASPFTWIGPRRRREPGVRWEDVPRIDTVLLSHDHYDHLDLATLDRLADRRQSQFIVPAGAGRLLRSKKIGPVHELDWGESLSLPSVTIHSVPALHFSGRGLFDRNRTLWCGYVIQAAGGLVYFAGDTGFGYHFAQIRERFGAPRLALLPIGAYEPRWFMSPVHMAPDQAVRAHEILGAKTSIAIHHGTFQLGDEAIDTPKRSLQAAAPGDSFLVLGNGQSVRLA